MEKGKIFGPLFPFDNIFKCPHTCMHAELVLIFSALHSGDEWKAEVFLLNQFSLRWLIRVPKRDLDWCHSSSVREAGAEHAACTQQHMFILSMLHLFTSPFYTLKDPLYFLIASILGFVSMYCSPDYLCSCVLRPNTCSRLLFYML